MTDPLKPSDMPDHVWIEPPPIAEGNEPHVLKIELTGYIKYTRADLVEQPSIVDELKAVIGNDGWRDPLSEPATVGEDEVMEAVEGFRALYDGIVDNSVEYNQSGEFRESMGGIFEYVENLISKATAAKSCEHEMKKFLMKKLQDEVNNHIHVMLENYRLLVVCDKLVLALEFYAQGKHYAADVPDGDGTVDLCREYGGRAAKALAEHRAMEGE